MYTDLIYSRLKPLRQHCFGLFYPFNKALYRFLAIYLLLKAFSYEVIELTDTLDTFLVHAYYLFFGY